MSGTTRITGIGTVGVPVTDQDRAVEFYVGKLGFEKRRDMPFGAGRWIEVAPPGSATTIALVPAGVPAGIRLMTQDAGTERAASTPIRRSCGCRARRPCSPCGTPTATA